MDMFQVRGIKQVTIIVDDHNAATACRRADRAHRGRAAYHRRGGPKTVSNGWIAPFSAGGR
jgi:hypothetical protein